MSNFWRFSIPSAIYFRFHWDVLAKIWTDTLFGFTYMFARRPMYIRIRHIWSHFFRSTRHISSCFWTGIRESTEIYCTVESIKTQFDRDNGQFGYLKRTVHSQLCAFLQQIDLCRWNHYSESVMVIDAFTIAEYIWCDWIFEERDIAQLLQQHRAIVFPLRRYYWISVIEESNFCEIVWSFVALVLCSHADADVVFIYCNFATSYTMPQPCVQFHHYMRNSTTICAIPPPYAQFHHYMRNSTIICAIPPLYAQFHHYMRNSTTIYGLPHHYMRNSTIICAIPQQNMRFDHNMCAVPLLSTTICENSPLYARIHHCARNLTTITQIHH